MQHQDINDYVKEKFIFVYDRRLLRHLMVNEKYKLRYKPIG